MKLFCRRSRFIWSLCDIDFVSPVTSVTFSWPPWLPEASVSISEKRQYSHGRAAAEGLELDVADDSSLGVDLDVKAHDITAGGGADEAFADRLVLLVEGTDVARARVV